MRTNRRILLLGGLALFLALVGRWLALEHTGQPESVTLPLRPAPVRSTEHRLPQYREMPEPKPATPLVVTATNASSVNAADIYRKAFALFAALSDEEKLSLADWKTEIDPIATAELCTKLKPITALAHEAAVMTNCDWGLGKITFETKLPYMAQARSLARAMVWNASHCRQDDSEGLADDVEAALRIGYSVSSHFLIGHLVNTAIQNLAMDCLTENVGALPGDVATRLGRRFSDGQYEESLHCALELEAESVEQLADRLTAGSVDENQEAIIAEALGVDVSDMDRARLAAAFRLAAELEREYVQTLNLPDAQYQAWLDKLHAAQQANPFLSKLWSAVDNVVTKTRAAVVQRAMVSAALALIQAGPSALENHSDPASGEPFVYRQLQNGFELESTYQRNGKPVVMFFRNR